MGPAQTNDLIPSSTSRTNEKTLPQVSERGEEASDTYSMKGFNNKNMESTHERMKKRGINLEKR